jgi:predicted nucleic acid-binding protein
MTVLVDTSIWVDHFRSADAHLMYLLENGQVICHQLVVGELACGNLKNRSTIVDSLNALNFAPTIEVEEYLQFTDSNRLYGIGIGFVDIHLLAAALLADAKLWSADKRLNNTAIELKIAYQQ